MKTNSCLMIVVLFLAACSSTHEQAAYEVIDIAEIDTPASAYWVIEKRAVPEYPARAVRNNQAGCVELSFIINPQGRAENIEVIRSFPGKVFVQSGKRALTLWQWAPSPDNPSRQAIKTSTKFDFTMNRVLNEEEAQAACKDLASLHSV